MATAEAPITRTELREELRHYATKSDLAELETRLIKWMVGLTVGLAFGSIAAASSIALLLQRLIG